MSPESMKSQSATYNFKTDAWSYGITLWEMYSRGMSNLNNISYIPLTLLNAFYDGNMQP